MAGFQLPGDLIYNRGAVRDPSAFAEENGIASWLYLVGEEFASMPDGMSYAQVQDAVPHFARVVSDPPRVLNLDLARRHVEALDRLPRPTLISCRAGPRASAAAYMYVGLKVRADPEVVLTAADRDDAPFVEFPQYQEWVRSSMLALQAEVT